MNSLKLCGSFTWEVTEINLSAIDSSIFTLSLGSKTITVATSDPTKVGSYIMKVKVYYTDYPTISLT